MKSRNSGVADNKTYKDQYHFNVTIPVKIEDMPSLDLDPKINATIKENPYASNVEIEGDEVVLQPDLSALFKAVGKKHKQGGMDVLLKPESFIFSDDKNLALTEDDHKLYEFDEGGKYKKSKSTPADVLKRNVDIKHYNTLVNNLADVNKDDLAKKSSARMLQKYIQTLGNIAYVQEAKKQFPDGIPSFSQGTAPVYNKDVKDEIMENKQYAKYGGPVKRYQAGGWKPPFLMDGPFTPQVNTPVQPEWIPPFMQQPMPFTTGPGWYTGRLNPNNYGTPLNKAATKTAVKAAVAKATSGVPESGVPESGVPPTTDVVLHPNFNLPDIFPQENPPSSTTESTTVSLHPPDVNGGQGIKRADWQFTPWQKLSQLYNWSQYATAKRYMPYRSRFQATYAEPSLLNPEQTIADVASQTNAQTRSLNTLNPILRNAQAQSIYGNYLDRVPGIRSQYDNQNAQITNQFRQYNNQIKNQETLQNMGNDQNYYQQSVIGQQNFDNLRSYLSNQAMNELFGDVSTNQQLAYNLLTQNNPAYGYDWRTGNFYRNKKSILDTASISSEDTFKNMVQQVQNLKNSGLSDQVISALVRGQYFKQAAPFFQEQSTPPPFGGWNPYQGTP